MRSVNAADRYERLLWTLEHPKLRVDVFHSAIKVEYSPLALGRPHLPNTLSTL